MMKERYYQLDNAKALLIILVVYAHFVSHFLGNHGQFNVGIWGGINSFHMACFLIISGFLSYNRINDKAYNKIINFCLIPYFIAQFIQFSIFSFTNTLDEFVFREMPGFQWLRPLGALWFLFAIGMYSLVMSLLSDRIKNRIWLLIVSSILLSVLMGFGSPIPYFRLTKLVCFFPYFVIGYSIRSIDGYKYISKLRLAGIPLFTVGIVFIVKMIYYLTGKAWVVGILSMEGKAQYKVCWPGDNWYIYGPAARIVLIAVAAIISLGLISIIPNKQCFLTKMGENSLYIYLLHWHLLKILEILVKKNVLRIEGIVDFLNSGYNVFIVGLPLIVGLCALLQSRLSKKIFRPIIEPNTQRLVDLILEK